MQSALQSPGVSLGLQGVLCKWGHYLGHLCQRGAQGGEAIPTEESLWYEGQGL